MQITVEIVKTEHLKFVEEIVREIENAAQQKGEGIAIRTVEYLTQKINEGLGVIALTEEKKFVGFCYIESWGHNEFVINSGLIVKEEYRNQGYGTMIKREALELSKKLFPNSKLLGLTTNIAVIKINRQLGYNPVRFSDLTDDGEFWRGCETCTYYDILFRTRRANCLCAAMIYENK